MSKDWDRDKTHLDQLFAPRSLALIGATNNMNKWGGMILANILVNGYTGRVYPVNPRSSEVLGIRAYRRVSDIPDEVDLACIVTPADTVLELLRDCARKGIRTVLVISSNFSEAGDEGKKREEALIEEAQRHGIRLVGPNSMGVFCSSVSLVCMMALLEPLKGDIGFVSQSGNIGAHMLGWGKRLGAGFRHFVSSGTEADLTCQDYIRYFGEDSGCRSVMIYLESVKGEAGFLDAAREVARKKPVVVFKGGNTPAGQKAAASHSGALAGQRGLYDSTFRQAGLIQARTTEAFIDCGRSLAGLPLPRGSRVGIITRGGGWGVITTDACEDQGLDVPRLSPETLEALDRLLPPYWSRGNPVDLVAVPDVNLYLSCTEILMKDPNLDGLIALGALPVRTAEFLRRPEVSSAIGLDEKEILANEREIQKAGERVLKGIVGMMRERAKPVVLVGGRKVSARFEELLDEEGLAIYPTPERAVRVMARLMEYARFRRRWQGPAQGVP